jgi:predicted transposase YdaD
MRHDPFFKTLLRVFLSDFLSLAAPDLAEHLNAAGASFLDKEFFSDGPKDRRREVDLLVRVRRRGSRGALLVHIEIEARARAGIARRLRAYSVQIQARHGGAVLSIVLNLQAGKPGPRVEILEEDLTGPQLPSFRYVSFGLAGCPAAEYLDRAEPLAWGLAALMDHRPLSRPAHKMACLRRIATAKLTDRRRLLLVNCVETYLQLSPTETAELAALQTREGDQEARAMTMTWADRMVEKGRKEGIRVGKEKWRQEGRREALRDMLLLQLSRRFGPLPDGVRRHVEAIASTERLTKLSEQILVAGSLDEMELS